MSNQITIKDLCPEEKRKIGELLKKLSSETEEKEKLKQLIEEDKKLYESKINSLKELSIQSVNYNDYKSESFAQSFIGNPSSKKNKSNPSVNDIQTLRVKFDELYETVKKAAKTNETLLSRIQRDSFVEDKPVSELPKPIEQNNNVLHHVEDDYWNSNSNINNNNILQTSFSDDIKKYGENEKSFMSSNEDIFNGLLTSKKNRSDTNYNTKRNINSDNDSNAYSNANHQSRFNNSNGNKYKEMLGRIREKSQEQHSNVNSNNSNTTHLISNQYQTSKIQYQFNQKKNENNNIYKHDVSVSHIQLNIPSETKNSNSNSNSNKEVFDNINRNNNISICENNEYKSVLNLLNSNKSTIAKLNSSSTIQNENLQTSTSIQSSSSKLEEVANDNLFNYIFALENKPRASGIIKQQSLITERNFNINDYNNQNEIEEVEKEINSLHEKTIEDIKQKTKPMDINRNTNNKQVYKTKYAKGINTLYEDFTKINSKYI